ncbi:MAG: A/G-specific adenine glycosylase [Phycisphaerae bacterium]|nr:A/G-specific adenine glycosylase [Phycisphaerae bacterium]
MERDRRIAARLVEWFATSARDLPWRKADARSGRRDAYRSLVSEAMLQQTQVARVVEKFDGFIKQFPTVNRLADADEQSVLAAWSGLGYYRRAMNLHRAAKLIVEEFGGEVPREVGALRRLPGVGRYTAGAIASMVFGDAEPLVDGNVQRVLLRVEGREVKETERAREAWVWSRAEQLVKAAKNPGAMNEALMELGATVCVPGTPRCGECPLARLCIAKREGMQERIPKPAKSAAKRDVFHSVVVVRSRGRVLLEQRPPRGLWAKMWQAVTIERSDRPATRAEVVRSFALSDAIPRAAFDHLTSHRRVRFEVWDGRTSDFPSGRGVLVATNRIPALPMSNPQRRILASWPRLARFGGIGYDCRPACRYGPGGAR